MPASKFALPSFIPHPKSTVSSHGSQPSVWEQFLKQRESFPPGHELKLDGAVPVLLRNGWACRQVMLADGRCQILDLYLPGEVIWLSQRNGRKATYVALTAIDIAFTTPPFPDVEDAAQGLSILTALQARAEEIEDSLLLQVLRLGRQTAAERVASLLVEIHVRLERVGQLQHGSFALPLTQETLGDILGLSVVHVNRTLQALKRQKLITTDGRFVKLRAFDELKALAGTIFQYG